MSTLFKLSLFKYLIF